jgi:hypothetical protein
MEISENHDKFNLIYDLLKQRGPGRTKSRDGIVYTIEEKIGENGERAGQKFILGTTTNKGTVRIYEDWDNDVENTQRTWIPYTAGITITNELPRRSAAR